MDVDVKVDRMLLYSDHEVLRKQYVRGVTEEGRTPSRHVIIVLRAICPFGTFRQRKCIFRLTVLVIFVIFSSPDCCTRTVTDFHHLIRGFWWGWN